MADGKNAMTNKTTIPTWGIASRISDRALVSCQDVAQSVLHAGSGRRKYWGVQGGVFALRYGFVPLRQRLIENREVS